MHRHGYKGRKFGRKTDQRQALTRGLMCALIKEQAIETTLARAKEIRRMAEKLITLARKGGLANRRLLIARLGDLEAATILMDEIAPQIQRDSGYLTIERMGVRRGDNAEMAIISFVDEIEPMNEDETTTAVRMVGGSQDDEQEPQSDEKKSHDGERESQDDERQSQGGKRESQDDKQESQNEAGSKTEDKEGEQ